MIFVLINEPKFEYDIHSLVKAFYPESDVKVVYSLEDISEATHLFKLNYEDDGASFSEINGAFSSKIDYSKTIERVHEKNKLKKLIYEALSAYTNKELAWGSLTGIRPTKIARTLLDEGKSEAEISDYMLNTYNVGDEKRNLAIDIAKRERRVLSGIHYKDGYSIYIGIPFCPTTCLYCSFTSNPIAKFRNKVSLYLDALEKEIKFVANARKGQTVDTIYIGGGTPTTLSAEELERLLSVIDEAFDKSKLLEYTVEAGRADSITVEKMRVLKAHGVTRVSVNPQTMNNETLKLIGRKPTAEDTVRAFYEAREAGFDNINMDIILGLPGEGEAEVIKTCEEIKKLSPDSFTVHSLAVKRASKMGEFLAANGYDSIKNTPAMMEIARKASVDMGMFPYYLYRQKNMAGNYENVGYAREGCFGIYNILIMEDVQPIVALGPGSVSKVITKAGGLERCDNVKDVDLYIEGIDEMILRKKNLFSLE